MVASFCDFCEVLPVFLSYVEDMKMFHGFNKLYLYSKSGARSKRRLLCIAHSPRPRR